MHLPGWYLGSLAASQYISTHSTHCCQLFTLNWPLITFDKLVVAIRSLRCGGLLKALLNHVKTLMDHFNGPFSTSNGHAPLVFLPWKNLNKDVNKAKNV